MEVYILDELLRRTAVVDRYNSMIWTERFSAFGDFQMVIPDTYENRSVLATNQLISTNVSNRVMKIETAEQKDNSDGQAMLNVSGRSLETILYDRAARPNLNGSIATPSWDLSGKPADILRKMFKDICVTGILDAGDKIPFYVTGSLYPADTIAEPQDSVDVSITDKNLYDAIKNLCNIYKLGFRLYRNFDKSQLMFNIYSGSDRTGTQSTLPPVIFSPDYENLSDVSALRSTEGYKNVAYVVAPNGSRKVYNQETPDTVGGFERRVLHVDATDITLPAGTALQNALEQRGLEELAKNQNLFALDGEIPQSTVNQYGTKYNLGDLVDMRDADGVTNRMRVTEQIFADDDQGERSYPTLTVDTFVTPGSWLAWDYNVVWDAATGTWVEQP